MPRNKNLLYKRMQELEREYSIEQGLKGENLEGLTQYVEVHLTEEERLNFIKEAFALATKQVYGAKPRKSGLDLPRTETGKVIPEYFTVKSTFNRLLSAFDGDIKISQFRKVHWTQAIVQTAFDDYEIAAENAEQIIKAQQQKLELRDELLKAADGNRRVKISDITIKGRQLCKPTIPN